MIVDAAGIPATTKTVTNGLCATPARFQGRKPTSTAVEPMYRNASSANMIFVARGISLVARASPDEIATISSPRKLNNGNDTASSGDTGPFGKKPPWFTYCDVTRPPSSSEDPATMKTTIVTTLTIANQNSKLP